MHELLDYEGDKQYPNLATQAYSTSFFYGRGGRNIKYAQLHYYAILSHNISLIRGAEH